jgi:hypothetical protein
MGICCLASVAGKTEAVVTQAADFFDVILDRFGELGGVDLDIPPRVHQARAADVVEICIEVIDLWCSR